MRKKLVASLVIGELTISSLGYATSARRICDANNECLDISASGDAYTSLSAPTDGSSNQKAVAVAGTAVQLVASATPILSVLVIAEADNTGNIFLRYGSDAASVDSTNGLILTPGYGVTINASDLSDIYIDAETSGDGISYQYVTE